MVFLLEILIICGLVIGNEVKEVSVDGQECSVGGAGLVTKDAEYIPGFDHLLSDTVLALSAPAVQDFRKVSQIVESLFAVHAFRHFSLK